VRKGCCSVCVVVRMKIRSSEETSARVYISGWKCFGEQYCELIISAEVL
jgi:hypothetical protein